MFEAKKPKQDVPEISDSAAAAAAEGIHSHIAQRALLEEPKCENPFHGSNDLIVPDAAERRAAKMMTADRILGVENRRLQGLDGFDVDAHVERDELSKQDVFRPARSHEPNLAHEPGHTRAYEFLTSRYQALGVTALRPAHEVFEYSVLPDQIRGVSIDGVRRYGVSADPTLPYFEERLFACEVHEATHAGGFILKGATEKEAWLLSSGWRMHRIKANGRREVMFQALEEYAATINESVAFAAQSWREREKPCSISHTVDISDPHGAEILCGAAELEHSGGYVRAKEWIDEMVRNGKSSKCTFNSRAFGLEFQRQDGSAAESSPYGYIVSGLRELALALYPELTGTAAIERFDKQVLEAQSSGSFRDFLVRVKERFGINAVKFIALLRPAGNDEASSLLHLYARADELPRGMRERFRNAIEQFTFKKYAPEWGEG